MPQPVTPPSWFNARLLYPAVRGTEFDRDDTLIHKSAKRLLTRDSRIWNYFFWYFDLLFNKLTSPRRIYCQEWLEKTGELKKSREGIQLLPLCRVVILLPRLSGRQLLYLTGMIATFLDEDQFCGDHLSPASIIWEMQHNYQQILKVGVLCSLILFIALAKVERHAWGICNSVKKIHMPKVTQQLRKARGAACVARNGLFGT